MPSCVCFGPRAPVRVHACPQGKRKDKRRPDEQEQRSVRPVVKRYTGSAELRHTKDNDRGTHGDRAFFCRPAHVDSPKTRSVGSAQIIRAVRATATYATRHAQVHQVPGLIDCPSHPSGQVMRIAASKSRPLFYSWVGKQSTRPWAGRWIAFVWVLSGPARRRVVRGYRAVYIWIF